MTAIDQSLRDAIVATGQRSRKLEELDNKIAAAIKSVEDQLRAVVTVRIETTMPDGGLLAFGKHNGARCLIVAERGASRLSPLLSAGREVRCRVLIDGTLLKLITDAPAQLDDAIRRRGLAITAAEDVITVLGVAS